MLKHFLTFRNVYISSLKMGLLRRSIYIFDLTFEFKTRNVFLDTHNPHGLIKLVLNTSPRLVLWSFGNGITITSTCIEKRVSLIYIVFWKTSSAIIIILKQYQGELWVNCLSQGSCWQLWVVHFAKVFAKNCKDRILELDKKEVLTTTEIS
jgi:hypothetical protein